MNGRAPPFAASRIAVRVIDVDGSPAVGATVEAYAGAFGFLGSPRPSALDAVPAATTTTGRDGTASLKVAPGGYRVRAFRGGAANVPAHVTADGPEATLVLDRQTALSVPRHAVFEREGKNVVYRWQEGHFEAAAVQLGATTPGRVVISAGLSAGDRIALADPSSRSEAEEPEREGAGGEVERPL